MRDRILALDLATRTGWAVVGLDATVYGWGAFTCTKTTKLSKWTRLRRQLSLIVADPEQIEAVVMEAPITYGARGRSANGARSSFGMTAHVEHWAERRGIAPDQIVELAPAAVKKLTTGHGHASKAQVAAACAEAWPHVAEEIAAIVEADKHYDETDALAIALAWLRKHGNACDLAAPVV